jgi:hypothetical protein
VKSVVTANGLTISGRSVDVDAMLHGSAAVRNAWNITITVPGIARPVPKVKVG